MPLPENIFILFYWTAPDGGLFARIGKQTRFRLAQYSCAMMSVHLSMPMTPLSSVR